MEEMITMGAYTMEQYIASINKEHYKQRIEELKSSLPSSTEMKTTQRDCLYRVAGTSAISSFFWIGLTLIMDRHVHDLTSACIQIAPLGLGFFAISTIIAAAPYLTVKHKYNSSRREIDRLETKLVEIENNKKHTK